VVGDLVGVLDDARVDLRVVRPDGPDERVKHQGCRRAAALRGEPGQPGPYPAAGRKRVLARLGVLGFVWTGLVWTGLVWTGLVLVGPRLALVAVSRLGLGR
jgi:hypothetical protein